MSDYLQRETECTCGDPECADCHPIAPLYKRMRNWWEDGVTPFEAQIHAWAAEVEKLERDQHELLEVVQYIHGGRSERYARSQRIKLLIKHGRIKEKA